MPETLVKVRTSERTQFAACRWAWYWSYVLRYKPIDQKVYFTFGDIMHQALALWYIPEKPRKLGSKAKRGMPLVDGVQKVYDEVIGEGQKMGLYAEDEWQQALPLMLHMAENYIAKYGRDDRYRVVAPEMPFQLKLRDSKGRPFLYVGQTDGVMEDLEFDTMGLIEHKNWARMDTKGLGMDEQAGSYWAYTTLFLQQAGIIPKGQDLSFILYNILKKAWSKTDRPQNEEGLFLNKNGSISKDQGAPLFERVRVMRTVEARRNLHHRVQIQVSAMQAIRDGSEEPVKSPGDPCRRCDHRDMCELHEMGGDWEGYRDATVNIWNPYEAHEGKGE